MTPLEEAKKSYVQHRPSAYITKIKKNKNGELDELVMITSFLDEFYTDIPITQRLKHYLSNELFIYRCELCSEPLAYRKKSNASYNKTCGSEICSKKQNYLSTSRTIKEKYGVSNISQTQTWKDKVSRY